MPHVVRAMPYHYNRARAVTQGAYISHGEKGQAGSESREVYGLGPDFKAISKSIGDPHERHSALQRLLLEQADKLPRAAFHHHVFTVDDRGAARLGTMDRAVAEQRLRHAVQQTFNASAFGRQAQGMYAIHWDGGHKRGAHPHVHIVYSPMRRDGRPLYVGPAQLDALKKGWNRSIDRTLEQRPDRLRPMPVNRKADRLRTPEVSLLRPFDQGIKAVRVARRVQEFARNPGQAAVHAAGRVVVGAAIQIAGRDSSRGISAHIRDVMGGQGLPSAVAGRAIELAYRAAIGKLAVPMAAARAILNLSLGKVLER